jgi:two-component sensor histidine kinase
MEPTLNPALDDAAAVIPRLAAYPVRWFDGVASRAFRKRAELSALLDGGETNDLGGDELEFRAATLRAGFLLGWIAIGVVLVGVLSGADRAERGLLLALTLGAAAANAAWMRVPWRDWLGRRRGQVLLDVWSAGLLAYVGTLVVVGGGNFALLLFLATPFLIVVHPGRRRVLWLLATAGTCAVVTVAGRLPVTASAMRFGLVLAIVGAAVLLERAVRREAAARADASARVEVERARFVDADHRVKNSLQTVADLLLLERPEGESAEPFEVSASRIRSIAAVHRMLSETGDAHVRIDELLELIVAADPRGIALSADPVVLGATPARHLGLIANELITNARKHGELPISVRLTQEDLGIRLSVENAGGSQPVSLDAGLGLALVRSLVEQGLGGELVLGSHLRGGVYAEATF